MSIVARYTRKWAAVAVALYKHVMCARQRPGMSSRPDVETGLLNPVPMTTRYDPLPIKTAYVHTIYREAFYFYFGKKHSGHLMDILFVFSASLRPIRNNAS